MSADIVERMRVAFRSEALELLSELDDALLALEADPTNSGFVHRVFRAIHTVKGSGATAGFARLAAVAHKVEEAFDLARSGRLPVSGQLVDCGLKACDILRAILAAENTEAECPGEQALAESVAALLPKDDKPASPPSTADKSGPSKPTASAFEITFQPRPQFFYSGSDPMTLLDELRALGQAHITANADRVPLFFDLDPECCYLSWTVKLVTERGEPGIRDVFTFVEDDCELTIHLLDDQSSAVALLGTVPAESLDLFVAECLDHLETVEAQVLELESNSSSRQSVDALFRAVHSIKGNAGVLLGQIRADSISEQHPLRALGRMAHAVESVLDPHRQTGAKPVDSETITLLLESRDVMQGLLDNLCGGGREFVFPAHVLEQLEGRTAGSAPAATDPGNSAFRNTATQCLDLFDNCLREFEKENCSPSVLRTYQRGLKTLASAVAYQKRDDLDEPVSAQLRILETAIRVGGGLSADNRARLRNALESARAKISGTPAQQNEADKPATAAAGQRAVAGSTTIRIDQEKLDRLMRVVGELLVAKGAFPTLLDKLSSGEDRATVTRALKETGAGISHIAEELQASVMSIRMLPLKTVFQRFPRLVRDLAHNLAKQVQLVIEGETIELDKTILEQIGDPLVHLVRNAVDHGLEAAPERTRTGKPAEGRVILRASNEAGNVVIEVEDDGRGLDAEKLKRKAVERGLITPEAASAMSALQACRLVFLPGLSTAEKVTDVSGRGVGMDVVQNNIKSLQGTVDIRSTPGRGTTFSIKLPTSLIISKGILLEAASQEYILPLTSIRDMVKIPAAQVHQYQGRRITQIRGEVYSVVSLAEVFALPVQPVEELPIAVIDSGKTRYALIADKFVSEVEVLVKPLAGALEDRKEFHGAAIMGDGRVVLVLNPMECHRLEADGKS